MESKNHKGGNKRKNSDAEINNIYYLLFFYFYNILYQ